MASKGNVGSAVQTSDFNDTTITSNRAQTDKFNSGNVKYTVTDTKNSLSNEEKKKMEHNKPVKPESYPNDNQEEEDIPGDFFDDFLKEDFMAGMDIVDEDEEESIDRKESSNSLKVRLEAPQHSTRYQNRQLDEQSRIKSNYKRYQKESGIKRDPEKTRRAIQQHKAKCEKDREKKLLTEKLNIVETGLVPPGMELEVDLEEVRRRERNGRNRDAKSRSNSTISRKQSSASPVRTSPAVRRLSPGKGRSPKRMRTRSPLRKRRSPRRESPPRRSPRRERLINRSRIEEKRHKSPYSYDRTQYRRSPENYRRGRDFGTHRRGSERISHDRYYRSRSRSRSREKRLRSHEKRSFLEELAEKLNEPRPPPLLVQGTPHQLPAPIDYAVPPHPLPNLTNQMLHPPIQQTNSFFPTQSQPTQKFHLYDENYFIGDKCESDRTDTVVRSCRSPVITNYVALQGVNHEPEDQPLSKPNKDKEVEKLFEDKKIRLSEFLAITAKPEVSSSTLGKLREKVKVIHRCEEAISILSASEKTFNGPFVVRQTNSYKPTQEKFKSPLLRYPVVKFPYTSSTTDKEEETDVSKFCQELLHDLGYNCHLSTPVTPPPLSSPAPPTKECYQKHTQTDPKLSACKECEKRKNTMFSESAEPKLSFSVSTQVSESDFYSAIPKTQSLASLTPAQLLGKSNTLNENASSRTVDSFAGRNFPRSFNRYNSTPQYPAQPVRFSSTRDERKIPPLISVNNATSLRPNFPSGKSNTSGLPGYNHRY